MISVKKNVWNKVSDQIWAYRVNCRVRVQLSYQVRAATRYPVDSQVGVQVKDHVWVQVRYKVENEIS